MLAWPADEDRATARRRALLIAAGFLATTLVHAVVGRETHALHVVHLVFGGLYLIPIVAAAVWLGARAGIVIALASAGAYVVHARTAWGGEPMENANHLAMAGVYVFVGKDGLLVTDRGAW